MEFAALFSGDLPECPPAPESPWVPLAVVTVDESGRIIRLKNCECRRLVASFSKFWWTCSGEKCCDVPHEAGSDELEKGAEDRWEFYRHPVKGKPGKFEHRWRRVARNGRIVAASTEGYSRKKACVENARRDGYTGPDPVVET